MPDAPPPADKFGRRVDDDGIARAVAALVLDPRAVVMPLGPGVMRLFVPPSRRGRRA